MKQQEAKITSSYLKSHSIFHFSLFPAAARQYCEAKSLFEISSFYWCFPWESALWFFCEPTASSVKAVIWLHRKTSKKHVNKKKRQKQMFYEGARRVCTRPRMRPRTRSCQRVTGYSKCLTCALCQQFWFTGRRMEHGSEPRHNVIGGNHPASSPLILQESNELKKTS